MRRFVSLAAVCLVACGSSKKVQAPTADAPRESASRAVSIEPYDLSALTSPDGLEPVLEVCPWEPVEDDRTKSLVLGSITELWTEQHLTDYPPRNCQLRVWRSCAPDMDGDGAEEAFFRVMWQANTEFGVGIPCEKLEPTEVATERHVVVDHRVLLSPSREWKLRAVVEHTLPGWKRSKKRTPEAFVELPNGAIGLRGTFEGADDGGSCKPSGIFVRTFDFSQWYPYDSSVRDFDTGQACP